MNVEGLKEIVHWILMEIYQVWRFGGLEVWRFGGLEVWRFGGLEVWRFGGLEVWRFVMDSGVCVHGLG